MTPHEMRADTAKRIAHEVLMKETFSSVKKYMDEEYRKLAQENCARQGIATSTFFSFNGTAYPPRSLNGTDVRKSARRAPPLHPELLAKFDAINNILDDEMKTGIENLFSIILSTATNGIVLQALIPTVLLNELKHALNAEEYEYLDQGFAANRKQTVPDIVVQGDITMIRVRYEKQFLWLRRVLMDRLLMS